MKTITKICFLIVPLLLFNQLTLKSQNALHLDGINDYVQTNCNGIGGATARTVEAWIKTTSAATTQNVIIDWGAMTPNGYRFTFNILNGGKIRIEIGGGGINGTTYVNNGAWHHVAAVYNPALTSNKYSLYVDGVLDGQGDITAATINTMVTPIRIGKRMDDINLFFGSIDEVRVYNTARSISQIQADKQNEICSSTTSGLVLYFKFNQGIAGGSNTGQTTLIGNGTNIGTLTNFALNGSTSNWVNGVALTGSSASSITATACSSYLSPAGKTYTSSGIYKDTLVNINGCDSIITINLTIGNNFKTINGFACDTFISPSGKIWTSSGVYFDTIHVTVGCDTIVTVNLLIGKSFKSITTTACKKYISPSGKIFSLSGVYKDTIPNSIGCDSILTITLTVDTIDHRVAKTGKTLTAFQVGGTYQWLNCDQSYAIVPGATSLTFTPTQTGNYAAKITKNSCTDTTYCVNVNLTGIEDLGNFEYRIYPNPIGNSISIDLEEIEKEVMINIYSTDGKLVVQHYFSEVKTINFDFPYPSGMYFLSINTNHAYKTTKIIK